MVPAEFVPLMQDIEARYKKKSGLESRAYYKIFYGPLRSAPILLLGINPGGDPANTDPSGARHLNGGVAAASSAYYDNGEHDVLDCDWKENRGLRKLLVPLLNSDEAAIRSAVVKTNLAFRRSRKTKDIDIASAKAEAAPFLLEIMRVVSPQLVILNSDLSEFLHRFCVESIDVSKPIKHDKLNQVVFQSASAQIKTCESRSLVVRVAHASQFSWTYEKCGVVKRINELVAQQGAASDRP